MHDFVDLCRHDSQDRQETVAERLSYQSKRVLPLSANFLAPPAVGFPYYLFHINCRVDTEPLRLEGGGRDHVDSGFSILHYRLQVSYDNPHHFRLLLCVLVEASKTGYCIIDAAIT